MNEKIDKVDGIFSLLKKELNKYDAPIDLKKKWDKIE